MAEENDTALTDDGVPSELYQVRLLVLAEGTAPFEQWYRKLRDSEACLRIRVRLQRVRITGNFGDGRERLKGPVSEIKIDYGPGYRLYYVLTGKTVVVLLAGGDKSSQQDDINIAHRLWEANKDEDTRFQRDFRG